MSRMLWVVQVGPIDQMQVLKNIQLLMEHMLLRHSGSRAARSSAIARASSVATRLKLAASDLATAHACVRDALPTDVTQMLEVDRACFPAKLQSTQKSLQVRVDTPPPPSSFRLCCLCSLASTPDGL